MRTLMLNEINAVCGGLDDGDPVPGSSGYQNPISPNPPGQPNPQQGLSWIHEAGQLLDKSADALCGDFSDICSLYGQMAQSAASAGQQGAHSIQQGESNTDKAIECETNGQAWNNSTETCEK